MSWRVRIALGWGAVAFVAALALAGAPGLSSAEAATMSAGIRTAGWVVSAPRQPAASAAGLAELSNQRGRPLLAETFHGFAGAGGERLGLGPIRGLRLGAALAAGLLAAALALAGFALGGVPVALLAPAAFWFTPRTVPFGWMVTPDLLGALLWFAAVQAYSRSLASPSPLGRAHAGLWSAGLGAAAAAVRPDLASIWLVLALHWGLGRFHLAWLARHDGPTPRPAVDWGARLRRIPTAVGAALLLIPATVLACWPGAWSAPLRSLGPLLAAVGWGQPAPAVDPVALLLAATPAPAVALLALGAGHAALRLMRALRRHDGEVSARETLWLLAGLLPLLLAAVGLAPRLPGLSPLVQGLAPLALLGARALPALAELAWPSRKLAVTVLLALSLVYPGLRAAADTFPLGASTWGEPLGGAPGAAWRGWPRQDGGEAVRGVLDDLGRHAVPGARILWIGAAPWAVQRYRQAGLIRADLVDAAGVDEADLAVVARDRTGEAELETWTAFGTDRPASGLFLDEVALVLVQARPGAWR
jgi:hypothetical protein